MPQLMGADRYANYSISQVTGFWEMIREARCDFREVIPAPVKKILCGKTEKNIY